MPTIVYHGTKKKNVYFLLLSLCYDNKRRNLPLCYTMQFTKCFCTHYRDISLQVMSSFHSDSLQLVVSWHNNNTSETEWSIPGLQKTAYPNSFCSLVSPRATLTYASQAPWPKAALPLLQKWIGKVQTRLSICLLSTAAFLSVHTSSESSITVGHIVQTSWLQLSQMSQLGRYSNCSLQNSQAPNHLTMLFRLENNIIGEILLKTKLNIFTASCQK